MLGTPLLLERPDDPFGPHLAALDTLASSSLPSHHLLIDTLRTCESALVSASLCFTPTTLSSYGSLTTSTKTSLIVIQERLLEWDVMNIDELRMIRDMRAMVEWCMRGSTHQLPPSRAHDYLRQLRTFIHTLSTDYQHACNMKPRSGCPYHSSCRWIDATWHLRHGMIPHRGWDHIEMERHMQPIHNTSILTLQTPEEEEEEWKEMLRVEKEKKEAELAAERERIARFEAEQAAAYQESEDEQTETESEEEDEKDGKKNKRSIRFAIEHPKPTSTPHHQPEEQEEKEESKEQEQEPPPAIIPVEPVIPPRRPLSFQFLCITCHTSLIRGHEIERIYGNQVYSKSGVKLTNIHVDVTDVWISRKQRGDDIGNDIDMEEIDRPGSPIHDDDEDEHQHSQLGAGVHDYIHHQHPQDDLSRTVYGKREESMGVHCSTCTSYIGRYYPSQRYYRLIYIHRRSGVNYMYYTGDASVQKLPPLLPEKDETDDETQTDDDDETQDDKDIKKEMIITPIYGLPGMYESAQQATIYPYPRFGPAQAYVMMKKHESQMSSNPSSSSIKRPLSSLTRPLTATSNREVIPLSTSRPQTAGTLTYRGKTPTLLAPTLELAQSIVNMLRNTPDPLYSISVDGEDAVAQVQSLMLTSMDFNNRRSMDRVTSRILTLMSNFPGTSIYANTTKPVIPLYLDFFIKPTPDLTACRGTARYVFHFLTGKDDSKLRRHKYSLKKMIHTMMRYDDCVFHLSIGGYGGHRLVLVKLGDAYRIFQSNACLENKNDRFTCTEWIYDGSRWSQILSYAEFHHFLALFEAARAHDPHAWNILFCRGKPQQIVPSTRPMDQYRPIKDTFYCVARLQESVKRWD